MFDLLFFLLVCRWKIISSLGAQKLSDLLECRLQMFDQFFSYFRMPRAKAAAKKKAEEKKDVALGVKKTAKTKKPAAKKAAKKPAAKKV